MEGRGQRANGERDGKGEWRKGKWGRRKERVSRGTERKCDPGPPAILNTSLYP